MAEEKKVYIVRDAGYHLFSPSGEPIDVRRRFYGATKEEAEDNYHEYLLKSKIRCIKFLEETDDDLWNIY